MLGLRRLFTPASQTDRGGASGRVPVVVARDLGDARRVAGRRWSPRRSADAGTLAGPASPGIYGVDHRDGRRPQPRPRPGPTGGTDPRRCPRMARFWIGRLDLDDLAGRSARSATTSTSPINANAPPPATPSHAGGITGPTTSSPRSPASARSAPRRPAPGGATGSISRSSGGRTAAFVGLNPSNWESGLSAAAVDGRSPKKAPPRCASPTTRPPTSPAAATPSSPPTTGV